MPLLAAPAVKLPPPVVSVQSPWPLLVPSVIVSLVASSAWVLRWALMATGAGVQFTAEPELLTA